jgi:glutamate carboxypeptidase
MLALLRSWVEFETPSLEPARVAAFADIVADAFAAAGCRALRHPDALQLDFGPATDSDAKPVLVIGHLDTVYATGTLASMPFRMDCDRVYGPGTFDMKGGIVQALAALPSVNPKARVRFLFVYDEELGSPRSRPLTERLARTASAALVLEPAAEGGKLKTERKGIAQYRVTAQGVAAHAGVDFERGASAVVELARRVLEMASWSNPAAGLTVNPGIVQGGTRGNVVAAEAAAQIDVRAWTLTDLEDADRRINALRPTDSRVRLTIEGGINRPPLEASQPGERLFQRARDLGQRLGLALTSTRTGGGSDGNFTAALGVPTLDGLGMVGAGAHAPHEHIEISALQGRVALLAALLNELGQC